MKREYTGKLYKLCEDYIRHCNFKYEMFAHDLHIDDVLFDELVKRIEEDIDDTVDKIQNLLNE